MLGKDYKIIEKISNFDNILLVLHKKTKEKRIAKIYNNSGNNILYSSNEEQILERLSKCDNIIKCYDKIKTTCRTIFIFERLEGDVMDLIDYPIYTELLGLEIFYKVCKAIKYCHDNNIAHLDIKPDNILFSLHKNDITIKLTDFGFSYITDHSEHVIGNHGTLQYNAPEIFDRYPYNAKKADIWSLGILLHLLLVKRWPHKNNREDIRNRNIIIHPSIVVENKLIIQNMLRYDPNNRPTIDRIIKHLDDNPFMQQIKQRRNQQSKSVIHKIMKTIQHKI